MRGVPETPSINCLRYQILPPGALQSGQATASSGTATTLPDIASVAHNRVLIRALPTNSLAVDVGGMITGAFGPTSGMPLAPADPPIVIKGISNLNQITFRPLADNDGISYAVVYDSRAFPLG